MAKLDADWLGARGGTIRPTEPRRELYERLKFVASLVTTAPQGLRREPRLLWRNERREVMSLALPERLVIGRDADCGLTLANPRVSRQHCEIMLLHGVAWLSDLGSTNGTRLNGNLVANVPVPLRDGDLIEIGGEAMVFVA